MYSASLTQINEKVKNKIKNFITVVMLTNWREGQKEENNEKVDPDHPKLVHETLQGILGRVVG